MVGLGIYIRRERCMHESEGKGVGARLLPRKWLVHSGWVVSNFLTIYYVFPFIWLVLSVKLSSHRPYPLFVFFCSFSPFCPLPNFRVSYTNPSYSPHLMLLLNLSFPPISTFSERRKK